MYDIFNTATMAWYTNTALMLENTHKVSITLFALGFISHIERRIVSVSMSCCAIHYVRWYMGHRQAWSSFIWSAFTERACTHICLTCRLRLIKWNIPLDTHFTCARWSAPCFSRMWWVVHVVRTFASSIAYLRISRVGRPPHFDSQAI